MGRQTRGALRRYQDESGLPAQWPGYTGDARSTDAALRFRGRRARTRQIRSAGEEETTAKVATLSDAASGPLPSYKAGTRFVFADGEVRTVVAADAGRVQWRSSGGNSFVTSSNFLIPRLSWRAPKNSGVAHPGRLAGRVVAGPPGCGDKLHHNRACPIRYASGQSQPIARDLALPHHGNRARLPCVPGLSKPRRSSVMGVPSQRERESRYVWHYAPEIGHYVLHEEFDDIGRCAVATSCWRFSRYHQVASSGASRPRVGPRAHTRTGHCRRGKPNGRAQPSRPRLSSGPARARRGAEGRPAEAFCRSGRTKTGRVSIPVSRAADPRDTGAFPGLEQGVEVAGKPS